MAKKSMAQKLREVDAENRRLIRYLSEIKDIVMKEDSKVDEVLRVIIKWQAEG